MAKLTIIYCKYRAKEMPDFAYFQTLKEMNVKKCNIKDSVLTM